MKSKLSLLLLLTFGVVVSVSADISCEPLGYSNWFCEELDTPDAQSYSWSTGSTTPFTFVNCGLSNHVKYLSLTITYPNGTSTTSSASFQCQNYNF